MSRQRRWTTLMPLLAWVAMIFWVASQPKTALLPPRTPVVYGLPRYLVPYLYHVGAFLVLTVLFLRHVSPRSDQPGGRDPEVSSVFGANLVSLSSELMQFYVPTRTPALRDLACDLLGAFLGVALMRWLPVWWGKNRQKG